MLVTTKKMLAKANKENYCIGAFNINNLEFAQAVISAAESQNAPIIVQTSQGAIKYAGLESIGKIVNTLANQTKTPVALHLDHGTDMNLIKAVIKSGLYTSVMIDGSKLPIKENIKNTKKIVSLAHKVGITVEAELGAIPGTEDDLNITAAESFMTDPDEAKRFIELTNCDSLAISIGTKHGVFKFAKGGTKLDYKRLTTIKKITKLPIVLHGASSIPSNLKRIASTYGANLKNAHGVSNSQLKKAIAHGVNKINTDSDLRIAFTGAVDKYMTQNPNNMDPRKYLNAGREAVYKIVKKKIKLFGSANKA